jgi:hypothetical protein
MDRGSITKDQAKTINASIQATGLSLSLAGADDASEGFLRGRQSGGFGVVILVSVR